MEREYSNLAKKITLGEIKKAAKLKKEMKNVPNDEDFKEGLRLYQIKKSLLARYMLVEIEKIKGGKAKTEYIPNENPEVVNLEHILPKSFPAKNWPDFNEEDHAKYSAVPGNLTIMLSDENENIAQNKFSDKKKVYAASQIKITNELGKLSDWTPAQLKKRQDELADLAIKRWAI